LLRERVGCGRAQPTLVPPTPTPQRRSSQCHTEKCKGRRQSEQAARHCKGSRRVGRGSSSDARTSYAAIVSSNLPFVCLVITKADTVLTLLRSSKCIRMVRGTVTTAIFFGFWIVCLSRLHTTYSRWVYPAINTSLINLFSTLLCLRSRSCVQWTHRVNPIPIWVVLDLSGRYPTELAAYCHLNFLSFCLVFHLWYAEAEGKYTLPFGSFCGAFCGFKACGAKPRKMHCGEPRQKNAKIQAWTPKLLPARAVTI